MAVAVTSAIRVAAAVAPAARRPAATASSSIAVGRAAALRRTWCAETAPIRTRAAEAISAGSSEAALVPVIHYGRADAHGLRLSRRVAGRVVLATTITRRIVHGALTEALI